MAWWHRIGSGRAKAAALEEQVTVLQAALAKEAVRRRSAAARPALIATGAVLILAFGFVLGANSDRLTESIADAVAALGIATPVHDAGAAEVAYRNGDQPTALRLARPLAEQGDVRAQSLVGLIHYSGRGGLRNETEAVKWFRLAADHGDAAAQFRLGLMYSEGQGVPQDHAEAANWYRLAADQRHPQAQYNLGLLYAAGEGVEQDRRMAHMWFNLAVVHFPASDTRNRSAAIRSRDLMAGKLSREEVAEAQKLAREWRPGRLAPGFHFVDLSYAVGHAAEKSRGLRP
jgi:Sel1 repeat